MTGPEHYVAAQELLSAAEEHGDQNAIAKAQVHATLALAAATAAQNWMEMPGRAASAWDRVAQIKTERT